MLNKLCIITIFSFVIIGCNLSGDTKTEENPPSETTETKPAESTEIKEGDTVVARWSGNSYYEGTVEKIDGSKMNVKWLDGSKASDVDKTDIYQIPNEGAKPDLAVGDMVLAKTSSSTIWNGAEVTKIDGDVYVVKQVGSSSTKNLDSNKVIKISPATAANFKDKAGSSEFLKTAQGKTPSPAKNYEAKKGDKVLALWSINSWYTGKVNDVKSDKITVAWDDGTKPKAVDADKVLPMPNASNVEIPKEDQYVLAKPVSGTRWVYAQAVSVDAKDIEIKDAKGATRTMKAGEVVPLN